MLVLNFKPFPNIETERLLLRKLSLKDDTEVFIQRSHPKILKYINREPAKSIEEARQFIESIHKFEDDNFSISWAITIKGEDKLIGIICFWNIDFENHVAEVGYGLHPDYFGKGIMTEALLRVCEFGFDKMDLKRVDAFTNKDNKKSLILLKNNGFVRNFEFEESYPDKEEMMYNRIFSKNKV